MTDFDNGYLTGWEEGRDIGYDAGFADAYESTVAEYEKRLAKYWTELHLLGARIAYLEKLTGGFK